MYNKVGIYDKNSHLFKQVLKVNMGNIGHIYRLLPQFLRGLFCNVRL